MPQGRFYYLLSSILHPKFADHLRCQNKKISPLFFKISDRRYLFLYRSLSGNAVCMRDPLNCVFQPIIQDPCNFILSFQVMTYAEPLTHLNLGSLSPILYPTQHIKLKEMPDSLKEISPSHCTKITAWITGALIASHVSTVPHNLQL